VTCSSKHTRGLYIAFATLLHHRDLLEQNPPSGWMEWLSSVRVVPCAALRSDPKDQLAVEAYALMDHLKDERMSTGFCSSLDLASSPTCLWTPHRGWLRVTTKFWCSHGGSLAITSLVSLLTSASVVPLVVVILKNNRYLIHSFEVKWGIMGMYLDISWYCELHELIHIKYVMCILCTIIIITHRLVGVCLSATCCLCRLVYKRLRSQRVR
jgi:hypothetical protein